DSLFIITRYLEKIKNCYCVHHSHGITDQKCVGDIAGDRFRASNIQCLANCVGNGNVQPNISQRHANSSTDTNKLVPAGHMQDAINFLCNNAFPG
ncbi:hypothetical protein X801_10676, partial [Opisthorchis viverrini]